MPPAASASYRLPQPRRWTAGRLKYASDGTSPATVAASSSSNRASARVSNRWYTPARNCRRVLKVAGSIMPDPTGQNRPTSQKSRFPTLRGLGRPGWVVAHPGPPKEPDVPNSGIRLLRLRIRCVTQEGMDGNGWR